MTSIPTITPDAAPRPGTASPVPARSLPSCEVPGAGSSRSSRPVPPVAPLVRPARTPGRRPADRRDARRPAGRAAVAVLGVPRPAVGSGGCVSPPAPTRTVMVRRRRAAAAAVLAVLLVGLVVVGVLLAGTAGAPSPVAAEAVPDRVTVTVVGAGESLSDVARRTAPAADVDATVERIRALNALPGASVAVGRPLTVPVG